VNAAIRIAMGMPKPAVLSSFQAEGVVVIHMATMIRPDVPILFIDTGYSFKETLLFKDKLAFKYDWNVIDIPVEDGPVCCRDRKVVAFKEAIKEYDCYVTGLRRTSSPSREHTPIMQWQNDYTLLKVNPIADWSKEDVLKYLSLNDLPQHPLYEQGYASIGCEPCTTPIKPGEDERAGRWRGEARVECGIHETES